MMKDAFDINLLSHIQALDKKMSVAKDRSALKRKGLNDKKKKNGHGQYFMRPALPNGNEGCNEVNDTCNPERNSIDITV